MPAIIPVEARSGRLMILAAAVITLLGDLFVILLTIPHLPPPRVVGSVFSWFLTAALFYAVWRGHVWARWLTVSLFALALLVGIPPTLRTMHPLLIGVDLQFAITIYLLAFPPSVSAFLRFQRARHNEST